MLSDTELSRIYSVSGSNGHSTQTTGKREQTFSRSLLANIFRRRSSGMIPLVKRRFHDVVRNLTNGATSNPTKPSKRIPEGSGAVAVAVTLTLSRRAVLSPVLPPISEAVKVNVWEPAATLARLNARAAKG